MASSTNYLITGAGRGIGYGVVLDLAQRQGVKIFATVRDTAKATDLQSAADKYGNITILTWRADVPEDSAKLVGEVKKQVESLDVVVANAGINTDPASVVDSSIDGLLRDFTVNAGGPLHLFQAVAPLLESSKAAGGGIFAPISSLMGSIADAPPYPALAYGVSKAALNWIGKRISIEHEKVRVLLIHPGLVKTDMAAEVSAKMGITSEIPGTITIDKAASDIVGLLDTADKYPSGSFLDNNGAVLAW